MAGCVGLGSCSRPFQAAPSPRPIAVRGWKRGFGSTLAASLSVACAGPALHMSKEVAGQPEGTTLLDCIESGAVPYPERMWATSSGCGAEEQPVPARRDFAAHEDLVTFRGLGTRPARCLPATMSRLAARRAPRNGRSPPSQGPWACSRTAPVQV